MSSPQSAATRPERSDPAALARWALVGLSGEALFTISWIVTGLLERPGYRPLRDDISDMGALTAPHPWILLVPGALASAALIGFALRGLRPALVGAGRAGRTGVWLAAISAIPGLSDALFRPDCRAADGCTQAQAAASWHGQLHAAIGFASIIVLVLTPFVLARRFRRVPQWRDLAAPSVVVGAVLVAGLFAVAAPQTAAVHGLIQRAIALLGGAWGALLAARLYRVGAGSPGSRRRPQRSGASLRM
jgi:hypothetical protein